MTSPTTASDRRGLPTALGSYASGLSAARSSSAARSVLAAPAIGDAFADVFRMIASVEGPSTPNALNAPADASPLESQEASAAEAVESEHEASEAELEQQNNAASSVAAQPLAETETKTDTAAAAATETETEKASSESESESSVGPAADVDADSDSDADARAETETATTAGTPSLDDPPLAADQQADAKANTDAALGDLAAVAGTTSAASAGSQNTLDNPTSTPDSAAAATTAAAAATGIAVEGSGESTSTTGEVDGDGEADEVVPARYAGEPQDATDRKSSGSHRRLRGQDRGERLPSDAGPADQSASTPSSASVAGTPTSNVAAQASAATTLDSSILAPAFAEPVATAAVVPPAAAAVQTLPAAAAAASSTESLKSSGSDSAATTRTGTAPTTGTEPTVSKDVRSATAGKEANEGPRVADRALLVQRVSRAFQRLGFDGGQVRIRLHPEELGGVQLQLSVQGQRMSGRVVAETEAARSILTQHLPELRQRLADQGMQVERLEVQLEGEQDSNSGSDLMNRDSAGQGRAGQGDRSPQRGPRRQVENPTLPIERTSTAPQAGGGGGRSVIEAAKQKTVDLIG